MKQDWELSNIVGPKSVFLLMMGRRIAFPRNLVVAVELNKTSMWPYKHNLFNSPTEKKKKQPDSGLEVKALQLKSGVLQISFHDFHVS